MENKPARELEKIKKIINIIINLLEESIESIQKGDLDEDKQELLQFLIGNKESVVSIITKLSNLLLKMGITDNNEQKIEDIDIEIIKKYLNNNLNKSN